MHTSIKIPCTLIPTNNVNLILPNSAIEEVIVSDAIKPLPHTPSWITGSICWHNQNINIVTFDQPHVTDETNRSGKHIIVVVRNPSADNNRAFFGILAKNMPQVIEANTQNIDRNLRPENTHTHAKSYVYINGKDAIIPDIDLLNREA